MDSSVVGTGLEGTVLSARADGGGRALDRRLRALVLLAGSVRESELSRDLTRSPLDLPLRENQTVLQAWCSKAAELAHALGDVPLSVRVVVDRHARLPETVPDLPGIRVVVECDPRELRGTGGVLRDIAEDFGPDDLILVGNAYQPVQEPLAPLAAALAEAGADVAFLAGQDQEPLGLKLVRRAALEPVKIKGFVDFQEQAVPLIARTFDVRVVSRPASAAASLRNLEGYIAALHRLHRPPGAEVDALAEDWFRTFAIIEPGAVVAEGSRVHDSVILKDARVGAGAVLVRSLVCDGAEVGPGQVVFDRVVAARSREAVP